MTIDNLHKNTYSYYMRSVFKKGELDSLKSELGVTMDQIILATKPKKEFKNWKVKISRLINKKSTDPSNFGYLELSALLAEYFNKNPNLKQKISLTHFIGQDEYIPVLGTMSDDGTVVEYAKNNKWKLKVSGKYKDCVCVFLSGGVYNGWVRIFQKLTNNLYLVNNNFGMIKEKKTKRLYTGYIQPKHGLSCTINDFSILTNKITPLHHNLEAVQAAKFLITYKAHPSDFIKG